MNEREKVGLILLIRERSRWKGDRHWKRALNKVISPLRIKDRREEDLTAALSLLVAASLNGAAFTKRRTTAELRNWEAKVRTAYVYSTQLLSERDERWDKRRLRIWWWWRGGNERL
jgi:hypothetical protein